MKINLAFGKTGLEVELADDLDITIIEPSYVPGIQHEKSRIRESLIAPIESSALASFVGSGDRVGIVLSDITRPAPNHILLPIILEAIRGLIEVDVSSTELFVATLSAWPITMAFMMMGLFLGAFLPSRRAAALTVTVIFIASYFGLLLAGFAESLEPTKALSLFNYFDFTATVFTEGPQAQDIGILLGIALAFFVLALLSFQRRNVTVGAWPWQRARVSE